MIWRVYNTLNKLEIVRDSARAGSNMYDPPQSHTPWLASATCNSHITRLIFQCDFLHIYRGRECAFVRCLGAGAGVAARWVSDWITLPRGTTPQQASGWRVACATPMAHAGYYYVNIPLWRGALFYFDPGAAPLNRPAARP